MIQNLDEVGSHEIFFKTQEFHSFHERKVLCEMHKKLHLDIIKGVINVLEKVCTEMRDSCSKKYKFSVDEISAIIEVLAQYPFGITLDMKSLRHLTPKVLDPPQLSVGDEVLL